MYNIYLNDLPDVTKSGRADAKALFKELACENGDLIEQEVFPTIIARYANEYEVKLLTEIANNTGSTITVKAVSENVFDTFDSEVTRDEQLDTHLLDKGVVEAKLISGIEILEKRQAYEDKMEDVSTDIAMLIGEHYDKVEKAKKFKPYSIYSTFIIWLMCSVVIFLTSVEEKLFICSLIFIALMSFVTIYDFIEFKKLNKQIRSTAYFEDLMSQWTLLCYSKNQSILDVEDMVDTLLARRCLNVLPSEKRNLTFAKELLELLDNPSTSLNDILLKI